jgi:hypothetical protein
LNYLPVRSVWENVFGFRPYSSGMMRSLSKILHGDLDGAWQMNPLGFVVLPLLAGLFILNAARWKRRARAAAPMP